MCAHYPTYTYVTIGPLYLLIYLCIYLLSMNDVIHSFSTCNRFIYFELNTTLDPLVNDTGTTNSYKYLFIYLVTYFTRNRFSNYSKLIPYWINLQKHFVSYIRWTREVLNSKLFK